MLKVFSWVAIPETLTEASAVRVLDLSVLFESFLLPQFPIVLNVQLLTVKCELLLNICYIYIKVKKKNICLT